MLILLRFTIILCYFILVCSSKNTMKINKPNLIKWIQINNQDNSEEQHSLILYNTKTELFANLELIDKLPINYIVNKCQAILSDTYSSLYMYQGLQALYSLSYIYKVNGILKQKGTLSGNNSQTNFLKILNLPIQNYNSQQQLLKNKIFFDYQLKIYQIDSKYYSALPKCYYLSRMTEQMVCQSPCKVKTIQNIIENVQLPFEELEQYSIQKYDKRLTYILNTSQQISIQLNLHENASRLQMQEIIPINSSILCDIQIEEYDSRSYFLIFQCKNNRPQYSIAQIKGLWNQTMQTFFDEMLVFEGYQTIQLKSWLKKTKIDFNFIISDDLVAFRNMNTRFYFVKKPIQDTTINPKYNPKVIEVEQSGANNTWIYILAAVIGFICIIIGILICVCKCFLWNYCKQKMIKQFLDEHAEKQSNRRQTDPDLQSSRHFQYEIGDVIKSKKCISSASTANTLPGNPQHIHEDLQQKNTQEKDKGGQSNQKLKKINKKPHIFDIQNPQDIEQPVNRRCEDCSIILEPQNTQPLSRSKKQPKNKKQEKSLHFSEISDEIDPKEDQEN